MTIDEESLARIAEHLEQVEDARADGETADLASLRRTLGPLYAEYEELLEAREALDAFMEPPDSVRLPRDLGRYTLRRELGRGGMGVVYEAARRDTGERVAVKVLRLGFVGRADARARFRREAEALARLDHPHIVRLLEANEEGDQPYYVMSLVEGRSLDLVVEGPDRPPLPTLCRGLADVADALHVMHESGLVHRDLKPPNLLLDREGRMMLADFGLATGEDLITLTRSGDLLGTPPYMSPEQLMGHRDRIDARTDVYGLGATLYYVLTRRAPFEARDLHGLAQAILQDRPRRPRALEPSVPEPCERIALTCLEKRSQDRYASAADLGADLRAFANGRRVAGRPVSPARRGLRTVLRHPWRLASVLLLALGAAYLGLEGARILGRSAPAHGPSPRTRVVIGAAQVIEDPVAFTSDGESMVVAVDPGDGFRLLSISLDGARQTALTPPGQRAQAPQIVDGTLYYRSGTTLVRVPETRVLAREAWGVAEAESVVEEVGDARVSSAGRILLLPSGFENRRLDVLDARDGARRVLVEDTESIASPRWSPDGTTIAYGERPYGEGHASALWLVNAATGARRRLAPAVTFTGLAWTPDGRGLVYFRGGGSDRVLAHLDVESGLERVLLERETAAALPVVGPGGVLAYLVDPWHYNLWLYTEGSLTPLTNYGDVSAVSPHWLSGGGGLLHGVFPPDRGALTIVRRRGPALDDLSELRTLPACFESLALAPDGSTVYFTERQEDDYVLQRADLTSTAKAESLLRRDRPLFALQVLPSGRLGIAVEADAWEFRVLEPDGTTTGSPVPGASAALRAPDGRWLSFHRTGSATGMWIQALEETGGLAGTPRPVPGTREIVGARWRPGRAELVVMDDAELASVQADTLERTTLARWPALARVPGQLAVAADGRIAVSLPTGRSTVKMVDNFAEVLGD